MKKPLTPARTNSTIWFRNSTGYGFLVRPIVTPPLPQSGSVHQLGARSIYVEAASGEGRRAQVSIDGGHSPRWAPDGDVLYYAHADGIAAATGTIIAATVSTDGGFRVTSRVERFGVDDLNHLRAGQRFLSVNYDVHPEGEEFVHISREGLAGRTLIWILNWPEIVRETTSVR